MDPVVKDSVRPTVVIDDSKSGAFVIILREAIPAELAESTLDQLRALPHNDNDNASVISKHKSMTSAERVDLQKRFGGFTQDVYKFGADNYVTSGRLVHAFSKTERDTYTYSGQTRAATVVPKDSPYERVMELSENLVNRFCMDQKEKVAFKAEFGLNNAYLTRDHGVSHHRDNEKDLEDGSAIATVSLGASRTFEFKAPNGCLLPGLDSCGRKRITLHHGDLLVMVSQGDFTHAIPKVPLAKVGKKVHIPFGGSALVMVPYKGSDVRYSVTLRSMKAKSNKRKRSE
jgi:alkylated DNA repair dioxygenase AlkB